MSALDALLGKIFSDGVEQELGGGIDFVGFLSAAFNTSTKRVEVTSRSTGDFNVFGTVTTTDDTPTEIASINTLIDDSTSLLLINVLGRDTTTGAASDDRATWSVAVTVARNDSSALVIKDVHFTHVEKDVLTYDVTFTISSQALKVNVIGAASESVAFECFGVFEEIP